MERLAKSKQEIWEEKLKVVASRKDRLEQEMDPLVIEAVLGLNMQDIPTSGSCEGHLDHGLVNPWITVSLLAKTQPGEAAEKETIRLRTEIESLVSKFNEKRSDSKN
jgi:hypothetical protein